MNLSSMPLGIKIIQLVRMLFYSVQLVGFLIGRKRDGGIGNDEVYT